MKLLNVMLCGLVLSLSSACDTQPPNGSQGHFADKRATPLTDYETARKIFWNRVYDGNVRSLYCAESFNSDRRRGYNVEHVFPMSWVTNGLNCGKRKQCRNRSALFNNIEADLHNLFPSRVDVNKERSSYRFGIVNGEKREFGSCDFEVDYRGRVAEPTEQVRGDVARAMFYMVHQYQQHGLKLFDKQSKLLIKWHESDPPSAEEQRRNDVIEGIQGNRNSFIDNPKLLTELYQKGAFKS